MLFDLTGEDSSKTLIIYISFYSLFNSIGVRLFECHPWLIWTPIRPVTLYISSAIFPSRAIETGHLVSYVYYGDIICLRCDKKTK